MKNKKLIFFILLLFFAGVIVFLNITASHKFMKNEASFEGVFQAAGNVTSSINRGVGRTLPINSIDEKKLGDEIKKKYKMYRSNGLDKEKVYLNKILKDLNWSKSKKFEYEIFVTKDYAANAYALPGGVIIVTEPLLTTVNSESELVAIIAHEIAHIENSHCFDAVKFEVLTKKIKVGSLGKMVDIAGNLLLRHSYSKTQEAEADDYAFEVIKNNQYDIMAQSKSFKSLLRNSRDTRYRGNILTDYFRSHPNLKQRIEKSEAKGLAWQNRHKEENRYIGTENLNQKISFIEKDFGENEWTKIESFEKNDIE